MPMIYPRRYAACAVLIALTLAACGGGDTAGNPEPTGDFEIAAGAFGTLVEGSEDALFIPIELLRSNDYNGEVALRVEGVSGDDAEGMSARFSSRTLNAADPLGGVLLSLAIDDLPLMPHTRQLTIIADDGFDEHRLPVEVSVEPTDAPNIYLFAGQSNMVGFPGDGTRRAGPGEPDESDPRVLQLNVSENNQFGVFSTSDAFTDSAANVRNPAVVVAEDPLHVPRGPGGVDGAAKTLDYIGLGLTFGKQAANDSMAEVVLVPAAWSGSAFCANSNGPNGQWNAGPVQNSVLGNSLLFDRAVTRVNAAIAETGGVLRGILWHQGESDANDPCAAVYADNLARLVQGLRTEIDVDRRGQSARGADANIPFVAGTMSRGGDVAIFGDAKEVVDQATRNLPNQVAHTEVSIHDDLVPPGYSCGNDGCIHFGAEALREMGRRYYAQLLAAAFETPTGDLLIGESTQ